MESHLDQAGVSEVLFGVLDGISMASQGSAGLRKALVFRAVELVSLVPQGRVPQRITEQPVEVPVSQITDATEALQVQVHAISTEIQTSLLPQLQQEIANVAQLISHERTQERVAEQPVDVAASPVMEEFVAVVHQERGQERIAVQRVDIPVAAVVQEVAFVQRTVEHVPVPQVLEEIVEVSLAPAEGVQQRTVEHVPAKVPEMMEETVGVALVPRERGQQRTAEQIVDAPQILAENVDVMSLAPQERVQRIDEQMVEVRIPQIVEANVDMVGLVPQERVQRIDEQVVEVPQERSPERIAESGYPSASCHGPRKW